MTSAEPIQSFSGTGGTAGLAIALEHVRKTFPGGVQAVDDVSLSVAAGDFVALLGPSGCGKSTLLRLIAGLEYADAGRIIINDDGRGDRRAFVFQDAHLLPWRTLLRNVELPLELMDIPKPERRRQALQAIEEVGLADAANRYPAQLSGGMRMRASLARALVTRPRLLLLDEPFAALDEMTRERLDEQLLQLWRDTGMTVLFVTHSVAEATFLGQRAVVFSRRPAHIVGDVPIEFALPRSADLRTEQRFAEKMRDIHHLLREDGDE